MSDSQYDAHVETDNSFPHRRARHITSIQIRNLTPFPARDAFASALSQPAEQPQFSPHGHLSDDLDVTLGRKRSRKVSINSVATLRSFRSEDGEDGGDATPESRGRKRAGSRVSFSSGGSMGRSSTAGRPHTASTASAPAAKPKRVRTASMASSSSNILASTPSSQTGFFATPTSAAYSSLLPDNSQSGLEKVIKSRLVESFVAISIISSPLPPPPLRDNVSTPRPPSPLSSPPLSPKLKAPANGRKARPSPLSPDRPSAGKAPSPRSPPPTSASAVKHVKHMSTSSVRSATTKIMHAGSSKPLSLASPPSSPFLSIFDPPSGRSSPSHTTRSPDYLSPIHRPSINPLFSLDPRHDFSKFADLSEEKIRVELWAKIGSISSGIEVNGKGKGKASEHSRHDDEWRSLKEWEVNLSELVPVPDDVIDHLSHLPSNTLIVTLSPPGRAFYLPTPHRITSRSPSPPAGYSSDPESELRKAKAAADLSLNSDDHSEVLVISRRRHRQGARKHSDSLEDTARTAGWQDLFKLVTLQACIQDTQASLDEITRGIERTLSEDPMFALKREISARETHLEDLRRDCKTVGDECQKLRAEIARRREQVRERTEILGLARRRLEDDLTDLSNAEYLVSDERDSLTTLRSEFTPTRTTLISTLAEIFPIELLSPPDLLFTILDVPLPIPVASTDPAPPLSLPNWKDVNDETVATALGYAAQVVQLLAAYMGKMLVYPVTCIGSKSMIRDGISSMVGPRMFPLFSRGVDTYRFEYGVFLLNKDIEMLMAEHDLRALDMRHTLPNLKNLLLTLTSGEGTSLHTPPRVRLSPVLSTSSLESSRAASPDMGPSTPKPSASGVSHAVNEDNTTPPATPSGATTPTVGDTIKRNTLFGLSFPSRFLPRYPLVSAKSTEEGANDDQSDGSDDEEEDRRTIRNVDIGVHQNGNGNAIAERGESGSGEKTSGLSVDHPPSTPLPAT